MRVLGGDCRDQAAPVPELTNHETIIVAWYPVLVWIIAKFKQGM